MLKKQLPQFLLALFFVFLAIVFWHEGPVEQVNDFIDEYHPILIALGTVGLISLLAFLTTSLSNTSAEKQRAADRDLAAEIKLSEFRQNWINELRDDLSEAVSLAYMHFVPGTDKPQSLEKLKRLDARLRMRLNPNQNKHQERNLETAFVALVTACEDNDELSALDKREEFAHLSAQFLKDQWDELKLNLEKLKREL